MLNDKDLQTLAKRGISVGTLEKQLNQFQTGFPYLQLEGSARVGHGIIVADDELQHRAEERWQQYLDDGGDVCKFVPASGAASRMFKALFAFVNSGEPKAPAGSPVRELLDRLGELPFKDQLDAVLRDKTGKDAGTLMAEGREHEIVEAIVGADGMNYGGLPKGLLTFHRYADGSTRTPVDEQLMEGAQTAAVNGKVKIHFTVSADHQKLFDAQFERSLPKIEAQTGMTFNVSTSVQKPSTDTVAVNPDNTLFRNDNGDMVFRPGGHGALIENLSDIDSTVVFIKNIDNVVPDMHRQATVKYKKVIAGVLVLVHDAIERYMTILRAGTYNIADLEAMRRFCADTLCIHAPHYDEMTTDGKAEWFMKKFNRPVRVCGMVVNEGEPGGGPYIAYNADGTASPQILESTQINTADPESMAMMKQATHFNPVDLVCYIKDVDGKPFDLSQFVDPATGFISEKSLGGRDLRALELPGLWNGAMSDWNTVFVQVPIETFNPVKTVNDLLRPMHMQ